MSKRKFRFAVRKFAPFESTMRKIWDDYCALTGCDAEAEFVAMDLPELHQAIVSDKGLLNGDWDAAHLVTDWLPEAHASGALENLYSWLNKDSEENYQDSWSSSLLKLQQFDQELLGLPFHDGPECLIYRKDLFESPIEKQAFYKQYGKELKVPETWEDFVEVARFFQRPQDNLFGTVFAAFPDGHNTVFDFCLQLWSRGGELLNQDGSISIQTKAAEEGLRFYKALLSDSTAVHPQSANYESVQAGEAFARGEVAMMINWFGFAAVCEVGEHAQVKGKVDVAGLPKALSGESCSLNVYWLYVIGAGSKNKQLAADFIRFATTAENDKLLTLEGGIGCRKSTWADPEINEIIPYYHKLEAIHHYAKTLPQKENWSAIAGIIDELVILTLTSDKPIHLLLEEAQKKIDNAESGFKI